MRRAPSATRTAISFSRSTARASSRLATFAHAISSTRLTTAISSVPAPVNCPRWFGFTGENATSWAVRPSLGSGYSCSRRLPIALNSACARSRVMPSFSRPTETAINALRSSMNSTNRGGSSCCRIEMCAQTCSGLATDCVPLKFSAATPTTVNGKLLRITTLPTTPGSAANRLRQSPWLSTISAWAPGRSSSAMSRCSRLPTEASTPSTSK